MPVTQEQRSEERIARLEERYANLEARLASVEMRQPIPVRGSPYPDKVMPVEITYPDVRSVDSGGVLHRVPMSPEEGRTTA